MTQRLFARMGFPEASQLGKRVFKKLFVENAPLTAADKKSLQKDVEDVTWQYTLKPSTTPIKAYEDAKREYLEVAVLEVAMRSRRSCVRLAEVIHRAIPYPLLIAFSFESECCLSVAPKRFSQAEKGVIVAEECFTTAWISMDSPTEIDRAFLDSLALGGLPHTNFLAFYSAWGDRFIAYDCALLSGSFQVAPKADDPAERRERLATCHQLETQIADLRAALNKEAQFNRQVELNTKIKNAERRLRQLAATL
jgi:hypothetical protein